MAIRVYIHDGKLHATKAYSLDYLKATNPKKLIDEIDNGSLISTGIWVTPDEFSALQAVLKRYRVELVEIDVAEATKPRPW